MTEVVPILNKHVDVGALLVEDCSSFADVSAIDFQKRTASNLCSLYRKLFELKKTQKAVRGGEDEILEHDKALHTVFLPAAQVVLPREKPAPKEKVKTKWERFREEKGMPPRKKRSRLVFDGATQEWLPRWGKGSIKQVTDKL